MARTTPVKTAAFRAARQKNANKRQLVTLKKHLKTKLKKMVRLNSTRALLILDENSTTSVDRKIEKAKAMVVRYEVYIIFCAYILLNCC